MTAPPPEPESREPELVPESPEPELVPPTELAPSRLVPPGWAVAGAARGSVLLSPRGDQRGLRASAIVSRGPLPGGCRLDDLADAAVAHRRPAAGVDVAGPIDDDDGVTRMIVTVLRFVAGPEAPDVVQVVAHAAASHGAAPGSAASAGEIVEAVITCAGEDLARYEAAAIHVLDAMRAMAAGAP